MENKESKMRKMIKEGCIATLYTLKGYFVKIYPAFAIDKIKFSFVEKGKKGEGFDVYVDTIEFDLLCRDIMSGELAKKIATDSGPYPGAWKYQTGQDASKLVAIGKSQKGGIVVQGADKSIKKNAFIPAEYSELSKMASLYNVFSGKTPVADGYWADLKKLFEESQENRRWHYEETDDEQYQSESEEKTAPAAEEEWPYPEPEFGSDKVLTVRFMTEITPAENAEGISFAEVEVPAANRSLYLWFEDKDLARREEFAASARTGHPVNIAYRVDNTGHNKYCWFVA